MLNVDIQGRVGTFDVTAKIDAGMGLTALYGRSGAGKSSILRAIAGLWTPDSGRISVGEHVLFDAENGIDIATHKRRLGVVFQNPLLFPTMNVERNLRYGERGMTGLWDEVLRMLDLNALLKRMPRHLSGGEAQRVALGRALLTDPRILLLDEPLTGLDDARRKQVMPYLQTIREAMRLPIMYVSHHQEEIVALADLVFVVENGRVTRELTPNELIDFDLAGASA